MQFDHIGVPAPAKREGMRYLESARSGHEPATTPTGWSDLARPESPVELIRTVPHVAYLVESLEDAMAGERMIAEPFDVFGEVRVSFIEVDGAPVEFVQTA